MCGWGFYLSHDSLKSKHHFRTDIFEVMKMPFPGFKCQFFVLSGII